MFPESLWDMAVEETIRYAVQSGEENFTTNVKELKTYLAMNIIMTYIKYPQYRMYWSSKESLRMDMIADSMPMRRFEKIKKYLHFTNNETIPENNKDIFIKIRPALDLLNKQFSTVVSASENLSIDEMLIPFKGRSKAKQYIQSKPKKWGFKQQQQQQKHLF